MHLVKQIADWFVIITMNTIRSKIRAIGRCINERNLAVFFALAETLMANSDRHIFLDACLRYKIHNFLFPFLFLFLFRNPRVNA